MVERLKSKQPRWSNAEAMYSALIRWTKLSEDLALPDYQADSRRRDTFLQDIWMREPHWAAAVSQLCLITASRAWTLTGGRNQVYRYLSILHGANPHIVNGRVVKADGWRTYVKLLAQSYYTTDMNAVTELGRDGRNGPLRALWSTDPAKCKLTGKPKEPLDYRPPSGRIQHWAPNDFFHVVANPCQKESFHGLGLCATSIAFDLVKMLYGVLMHDQEQIGTRMPQGIMLLDGVSSDQWEDALEQRRADLDSDLRRYFGGLFVLFSEGLEQMDYKLIALSQLPANFDRKVFMDQVIYGYAMILGMDPSEFWPIQSGALGRGRETEVQHRKALTKGASEFVSAFQEQLQNELPETVAFEFEQRDVEGEQMDAELTNLWADAAATLAGSKTGGMPLVDPSYIPSYLVSKGVWPEEWTLQQEETIVDDMDRAQMRTEVHRAIAAYPNEPIIRVTWPTFTEKVLWQRGEEATRPRVWRVQRWPVSRQRVLYQDGVTITETDADLAIAEARRRVPEMAALIEAPEV